MRRSPLTSCLSKVFANGSRSLFRHHDFGVLFPFHFNLYSLTFYVQQLNMDYKLSFPTLQRLALVNIGSSILNKIFCRYSYHTLLHERISVCGFTDWAIFRPLATGKIESLALPELVLKDLWDIVMQLWFRVYETLANCEFSVMRIQHKAHELAVCHKLFFNGMGEFDNKEMLESSLINSMVDKDLSDMRFNYDVACEYCLEELSIAIFQMLPDVEKEDLRICCNTSTFINYWYTYICFDRIPDPPIYVALLRDAMKESKHRKVDYFWHKLNTAQKRQMASRCGAYAIYYKQTKILCSALQHMDQPWRVTFLTHRAVRILECLLQWPYDEFFLPTLDRLWNYLSETDCTILFGAIIEKIYINFRIVPRFRNMLHEFWNRWPDPLKLRTLKSRLTQRLFMRHFVTLTLLGDLDSYEIISLDIQKLLGSEYTVVDFSGVNVTIKHKRECFPLSTLK